MTTLIKYGIKLNIDQLLELVGDQLKTFNDPSMFTLGGSNIPGRWMVLSNYDLFDDDLVNGLYTLTKNVVVSKSDRRDYSLIKFSGYNNTDFLHEIFTHFLGSKITEVEDHGG